MTTNEAHGAIPVTVLTVVQQSPTIKRLQLKVDDKSLTFKAGQWVDFFIKGVSIFTGYSMYSSPRHLRDDGILELAVKYSDYPPTKWVHTQCKAGDQVRIKVGGAFFYDPNPDDPKDLLLLAAGIGITPILSIYQHYNDLHETISQGKLSLLYSAKNMDELIFKDEILQTAAKNKDMQVQLFATTSTTQPVPPVTNKRVNEEDIRKAMETLNKTRTKVYVCGPSSFIDDMEMFCLNKGLTPSQIIYEKWDN